MKPNLLPTSRAPLLLLFTLLLSPRAHSADKAAPLSALGKMPVREITVFKDGHAFVDREGNMSTDAAGNVLLDDLPTPVLGTFWPFSAEPNARLTGTVASRHRVLVERTALTLREMLEANIGAEAIITEDLTNHYPATILSIPTRSAEELEATSGTNSVERLPEKGNLILLGTAAGTKAVSLDRIQDVTFKKSQTSLGTQEEFRNLLTLKLDWARRQPAKSATVGLLYLQKGMRWIPDYKVSLDGKGQAAIKLQATLINELTDLEDVTVNLVIGVPTFYFKDTLDPMALQQTLAQLSQYFQTDPYGRFSNGRSAIAYNFSNAMMSQQARAGDYAEPAPNDAAVDLGPEIGDSKKNEDLYVFNLQHVTLKRGERMVVPVAEFTLPYKDVFTLDLPFGPPPEVRGNLNSDQQREISQLIAAPKVNHKVRLANNSKIPLTTAPALIFREGRVLSQAMMTYAAPGSQSDLAVTVAVDVSAKKTDTETKRTPNALSHDGSQYTRVDMKGRVTLTNRREQSVDVEITRFVLGNVDSAGQGAQIEKINVFEEGDISSSLGGGQPYWWSWYGWPQWWSTFNGVGRIKWKLTLEPGKPADLDDSWYYYWR